jgi:hypothetical protein
MHEKLKIDKKILEGKLQGTGHFEDLKTLLMNHEFIHSFKSNELDKHIFRKKCFLQILSSVYLEEAKKHNHTYYKALKKKKKKGLHFTTSTINININKIDPHW